MAKRNLKPKWIENVSVNIVDMTPDLATELLEGNTDNRKIKKGALAEYVEAMQLGYWQFNGDPVRVANDGRLIDGQHRLLSVIETGLTVPMVLIEGLPAKAQMTMDAGAKRVYSDHLRILGEQSATTLAAIVRLYALCERVRGQKRFPTGGVRISMTELDSVLKAHPDLRESVANARRIYQTGFQLSTTAVGVAWYELHQIDRKDAAYFFERVELGTQLLETDHTQPILMLRKYAHNKKVFEHRKSFMALGGLYKAWNAFRHGEQLRNAAPRFGGENPESFPWPI